MFLDLQIRGWFTPTQIQALLEGKEVASVEPGRASIPEPSYSDELEIHEKKGYGMLTFTLANESSF